MKREDFPVDFSFAQNSHPHIGYFVNAYYMVNGEFIRVDTILDEVDALTAKGCAEAGNDIVRQVNNLFDNLEAIKQKQEINNEPSKT